MPLLSANINKLYTHTYTMCTCVTKNCKLCMSCIHICIVFVILHCDTLIHVLVWYFVAVRRGGGAGFFGVFVVMHAHALTRTCANCRLQLKCPV